VNRDGGRSSVVGRAREAGRGWHGSGILEVAFIGLGEDTGGAAGERKGRHQWRPVRELMERRGRETMRRTFPREVKGIGNASGRLLGAQERRGMASRRGGVAAAGRWRRSASIQRKEKGASGPD
jgi:hypothetical protein